MGIPMLFYAFPVQNGGYNYRFLFEHLL